VEKVTSELGEVLTAVWQMAWYSQKILEILLDKNNDKKIELNRQSQTITAYS